MSTEGHYETKTYRCGKVGEKVKYFVPACRVRHGEKSSQKKIEGNRANGVRRAARVLNENFRAGDGWLTLTYDRARYEKILRRAMKLDPAKPQEDRLVTAAEHELRLCLDRARRALRKEGVELKYFAVTADMDGATGEPVRVHHHVIVPASCVQVLKEKWGSAEYLDPDRPEWKDKLWDMEDFTPLAEYMVKQVRHRTDAKAWMCSRNLIRCEPKARKVLSGAQLRAPRGCRLLYAAPYTGVWDCQYIRYLLPEEEWTGVHRKLDPTTRGRDARDRITKSGKGNR
jgi:hypothetical protein